MKKREYANGTNGTRVPNEGGGVGGIYALVLMDWEMYFPWDSLKRPKQTAQGLYL